MNKTKLEMEFLDALDKKFILRVDNPREDLTDIQVSQAMEDIIRENIFLSGNLDLAKASTARLVTVSTSVLEI